MNSNLHAGSSRDQVYQQMAQPTQQLAADLAQNLDREKHDTLMLRHEIGCKILDVTRSRATYGAHAIEQLAQYLGVSPDWLYKLRNFSTIFPCDQLQGWTSRKMSNGGQLSFHHLAAVMVVRSAEERAQLVERVFTDSLSVRALREIIKSDDPEPKRQRDAKSLAGSLEKVVRRSKLLVKDLANLEASIAKSSRRRLREGQRVSRDCVAETQQALDDLMERVSEAKTRLFTSLEQIS